MTGLDVVVLVDWHEEVLVQTQAGELPRPLHDLNHGDRPLHGSRRTGEDVHADVYIPGLRNLQNLTTT